MANTWNDQIAYDPIRAEMRSRIEELWREFRKMKIPDIVRRAEMLRSLGDKHGFEPVRQIAGSLAEAIERDGRGAIIPAYLQTLLEAVYCDSQEPDAGERFLASVQVRLAG